MVSWGDIKKAISQADDLDDILLGAAGLAKDGFEYWVDNPHIKRAIGNARYANAEWGIGALPDEVIELLNKATLGVTDDPEDYDATVDAYKEGGGRAVWESEMGRRNILQRGIFDIAADPTTLLTLGSGQSAKLAARGGAKIAAGGAKNQIAGTAMRGVGRLGQAATLPDRGVDFVAGKAVNNRVTNAVASRTIGRAAKKGINFMSELAPKEQVRKKLDALYPIYKTANNILFGTQEDEGLGAARAAGAKLSPLPGQDLDEIANNAWASGARNVDELDVGDRVFPGGDDSIKGKTITQVAKDTLMEVDDDFSRVDFLGEDLSWDVGAKREDVEKMLNDVGSGKHRVKKTGDPFTDTKVKAALQGISSDIPAFRKGTTRDQYRKRLEDVGKVGKKTPLTPAQIDDAMMVYDDWFKTVPAMSEDEVGQFLALFDKYTANGIDIFTADQQSVFRDLFKKRVGTDQTIEGLGDEGNAILFDKVFTKGEYKNRTYFDALKDIERQYDEDRQKVLNAVGPGAWKHNERKEVVEQLLKDSGDKDALAAWKKWEEEGVDLMIHPKEESVFSYFERFVYADEGIATMRRKNRLSAIAAVWKGQALISPRYHASNIAGAYFNVLLTNGGKGMPGLGEFWNQMRYAAKDDPNRIDTFYPDSTINDHLDKYGRFRPNRNTGQGTMSVMDTNSQEQIERAFGRVVGQSLGRPVGKVFDFNRRMGVAIDATARGRLWATKMDAVFEEKIPEILSEIHATAGRQGLVLDPDIDLLPDQMRDPQKLLGYYRGLGFSDGNARHLSRTVANVVNIADKEGIATVHKGLFSYYRTRTDEALAKVIPFHYYASRSTALYLEEMMRNPVLLVNFGRMAEEMFSDYENSGLNARQKGWIKVMSNHYGFAMLMNPDALFGFTRSMGLMGDNYESDETQLGGILKWMKAGGFGMYPWVDGLFNMIGTSGDTFEPDLLGIRHRALVGAAVNAVAAEIGAGEGGMTAAPWAEVNARAREHISQAAASFLPGWLAQPVRAKPNDSGTIAEASFERLIESRVIYNNQNLTNQQLFDIMNDPDHPEYQKARKEIGRSGILNQMISFTVPIGLKVRESSGDVRSAIRNEHYKQAEKLGVNAFDLNPVGDAEFAARYKARTGKDWSPNDLDVAQAHHDLVSATPEARPYLIQLAQYSKLGTDLGRRTIAKYYQIKNGEDDFVKNVPKDQWGRAADIWLSNQSPKAQADMEATQAMQQLYRQSHPEIGQYKDWTGQMSYLKKLSGGNLAIYRERVSKGNPSAAAYFEGKKNEYLKKYRKVEDFLEAMDKATITFDAYLAVNGIAKKKFDQRPLPTNNESVPYDPSAQMVEAERPGSGGTAQQQPNQWQSFLQGF